MIRILRGSIFASLFYSILTAPQQPEISEQLEITDPVTINLPTQNNTENVTKENIVIKKSVKTINNNNNNDVSDVTFSLKIYRFISEPLYKIFKAPKVNFVLRNIGVCLVNGAMEIFTFYLPPPMLPLIASAAGLIIPFEPVVMLKEKMPVTSYRRAFKTAMNTFLSTFDQYKMEDDYDPYMTRRFNRRFMDDDNKKKQ